MHMFFEPYYLKDCKVNYTPDGVRSHADGSPVHITMALTFAETEIEK